MTKQVLKYILKVWNGMAHPNPVKEEDLHCWRERCGRRQVKDEKEVIAFCRSLREQIAPAPANRPGCDAVMAKEWYQRYGHDVLPTREEMFVFFFKMKHATAKDVTASISQFAAGSYVVHGSVKKVRGYLNTVWWPRFDVLTT